MRGARDGLLDVGVGSVGETSRVVDCWPWPQCIAGNGRMHVRRIVRMLDDYYDGIAHASWCVLGHSCSTCGRSSWVEWRVGGSSVAHVGHRDGGVDRFDV